MRLIRYLLRLSSRIKIVIAVVAVGLAILAIAYFEPHKLFIDEEVNEDFPAPVAIATATEPEAIADPPPTTSPEDRATPATTSDGTEPTIEDRQRSLTPTSQKDQDNSPTTAVPTVDEVAMATTTTTLPPITTTTAETAPQGPVLLSSSQWISIGHPGTGSVLVYRQPDGSHVIRFEDLEVSNGPDLLVILSASPLVDDRAAYSEVEYFSLGDLKGNRGNQNYEVPPDVNLDEYLTVAIWCRRFNYTFNAADIHLPPA